jgi:hypothetical protein
MATGTIAMTGVGSFNGDGVTARIFVDGIQVYSHALAYNDATGVTYTLSLALHPGTVVDFAIDPNANDFSDHTEFTAHISSG